VFLCGIFWFIYQDLDNLNKPWFMHALGMIAILFALFWLLIPTVVVRFRIRRRRMQNEERYRQWLADGGLSTIRERPARNARLALEPGELARFHEKGTLYIDVASSQGLPAEGQPARPVGRPSDVAFPGFRRKCRIAQRTHCYFTSCRVAFAGKDLDFRLPFGKLRSFTVQPGGIVFEADVGSSIERCAFTFHNPLVAADILRFAKEGK
jgi:hypothetical protein